MLLVLDPAMHDHRAESIRESKILSDKQSICCSDTSEAIQRARAALDYLRSCPVEIDLHDIGGIKGK